MLPFPRILYWLLLLPLCLNPVVLGKSQSEDDAAVEAMMAEEAYQDALSWLYPNGTGPVRAESGIKALKKAAAAGHARAQYALGYCYRDASFGLRQSDSMAFTWFARSARQSYPMAMLEVATAYFYGIGVGERHRESRRLLEETLDPAARASIVVEDFALYRWTKARAAYLLSLHLIEGKGGNVDIPRGLELLRMASDGGEREATRYLAVALAEGEIVDRDMSAAKERFEMLVLQASDAFRRQMEPLADADSGAEFSRAAQEQATAVNESFLQEMLALQARFAADLLAESDDTSDVASAVALLEEAALEDNRLAQLELGVLHYRGAGVERSHEKAFELFKAASTEQFALGLYNMSVMLRRGDGVEKDIDRADRVREQAAAMLMAAQLSLDGEFDDRVLTDLEAFAICERFYKKRDPRAIYSWALRRSVGWRVEFDPDPELMLNDIRKAARKGDARAQFSMGIHFLDETRGEPNPKKAYRWVTRAADQDHAPAVFQLAVKEHSEVGPMAAISLYERAAKLGYADAKNNLASIYESASPYYRDLDKAMTLYREAASEGSVMAKYNIGKYMLSGENFEQNTEEGLSLLREAAEAGLPYASVELADVYKKGEYVEKNLAEMAYWTEKGAEAGDQLSRKRIAKLYHEGEAIPRNLAMSYYWVELYLQGRPVLDEESWNALRADVADFLFQLLTTDYEALQLRAKLLATDGWYGYAPDQAYEAYEAMSREGLLEPKLEMAKLHAANILSNPDPELGFKLCQEVFKKAENNERLKSKAARAAYFISQSYEQGLGVEQSDRNMARWAHRASVYGSVGASFKYALCLVNGDGVKRDLEEGASRLYELAEQGHMDALLELARVVFEADVNVVDSDLVIDFLKQATDRGNRDAQRLLRSQGITYPEGGEDNAPKLEKRQPTNEAYGGLLG